MERRAFHKMHGLGNDFVIFDARDEALTLNSSQIRQLADRRHGIGCDQLIIIGPSQKADISMRIFNSDGGEVSACGNATRCVVALVGRDNLTIQTSAGLLKGELHDKAATIAMGQPAFDWQAIPLAQAMDTGDMPVGWPSTDGMLERPAAVNVGNPHAIFFVEDIEAIDLATTGPEIENDPLFPERVNVNVAAIRNDGGIDLHVWERGAGLTEACGTGACATAVAAIRQKRVTSPVHVHLPGGVLTIDWQPGQDIMMTGPFTHVFTGEVAL